jgi:hypothetical protein
MSTPDDILNAPIISPLPQDTILDTDPDLCDLEYGAVDLMKAIYLESPLVDNLRQGGWSDTTIINAFEHLRRSGYIRVRSDQDKDEIWIELVEYPK